MDSWEQSVAWYTSFVGDKGHYYHQSVILPSVLRLLELKKKSGSLLDLGCGQGVLSRHIPDKVNYVGVDISPSLIQEAKKLSKRGEFHVSDVSSLDLEKKDFDWACMILCLQNMEHPDRAIQAASQHLKDKGQFLLVLNHPCFRIPRQSHWGIDQGLQYRRMNLYMSPLKIPIQMEPGKKEASTVTFSYHYPLSAYTDWLKKSGFKIAAMEEWISDKKSTGAKAKMEDRARKEFPLFLALLAEK